jgi:hypothetical protein
MRVRTLETQAGKRWGGHIKQTGQSEEEEGQHDVGWRVRRIWRWGGGTHNLSITAPPRAAGTPKSLLIHPSTPRATRCLSSSIHTVLFLAHARGLERTTQRQSQGDETERGQAKPRRCGGNPSACRCTWQTEARVPCELRKPDDARHLQPSSVKIIVARGMQTQDRA